MAGNEFVTGYQEYETDTEEPPTHFSVDDEEAPVFVDGRVSDSTGGLVKLFLSVTWDFGVFFGSLHIL